jgi:hypothetical protein
MLTCISRCAHFFICSITKQVVYASLGVSCSHVCRPVAVGCSHKFGSMDNQNCLCIRTNQLAFIDINMLRDTLLVASQK